MLRNRFLSILNFDGRNFHKSLRSAFKKNYGDGVHLGCT